MELTIHVSDELAAQAQARGVAPETLAEELLHARSPSKRLHTLTEREAAIDALIEMSSRVSLGLDIKALVEYGRKY